MGKLEKQIRRNAAKNEIARNRQLTNELIESRKNLGIAEMLSGMIQQGISKKDLDDAYSRGYNDGRKECSEEFAAKCADAAKPYLIVYVAAMAIALHRHYRFGGKRAGLAIAEALEVVRSGLWIDPEEIVQQCRDEVGLDIETMGWDSP